MAETRDTLWAAQVEEEVGMPRIKKRAPGSFGARLTELRKAAGYTQVELASEIGVSQRVVAYYEIQTDNPPSKLLPEIARVLGVTTDTLLGVNPPPKRGRAADSRLERRLQQLEKLGVREKRQILQLLDTFLEDHKLRRRAGNGTERAA
jgi:transcriptional regulator with XRE-family HTH domain